MLKSYQYGLRGEELVCEYLKSKGYKILSIRFKTAYGEIDIIACHEDTIIFTEVKARTKLKHYEVLSNKQIKRISQAANYYLAENGINDKNIRFDFILLEGNKVVSHIENAWEYAE